MNDGTQNTEARSTVSDSPHPTLPGIDIPRALKRMGLSWDRFRRLLSDISKDQKVLFEKLGQAVKDGKDTDIRLFAHSMAGVSGNISADKLYKAAKTLQKKADVNDKKGLRSLFEAVEKEFRVVENAICSLEQDKAACENEKRKVCLKERNDTLKRLEKSLKELDPFGSSQTITTILGYQLPDDMDEKIREIDHLVNDFRFDKAGRILSEIMKKVKE